MNERKQYLQKADTIVLSTVGREILQVPMTIHAWRTSQRLTHTAVNIHMGAQESRGNLNYTR